MKKPLCLTYLTEITLTEKEGSYIHIEPVYDADGYPWLQVLWINIDPQQIAQISEELEIPYTSVFHLILAHEYGHTYAFHLGQDDADENLAWEYAEKIFCLPHYQEYIDKIKIYSLASYGLI